MFAYLSQWPSLGFGTAFQRHISAVARIRLRRAGASLIAIALFATAAHAQVRPNVDDFDGDGKSDPVVFRPSSGWWFALGSSGGSVSAMQWGLSGDVPLAGNFAGDGRVDVAVWRPSTGIWYLLNRATMAISTYSLGASGDIPLLGDFDGDGKADLAIFHPPTGRWSALVSGKGYLSGRTATLGKAGDIPLSADFDGDGATDLAVFRPSTGMWFITK